MSEPTLVMDSSRILSEERDIRVEDYLNDKLQTTADLDVLDSILENVRNQQNLLKEQVCVELAACHSAL